MTLTSARDTHANVVPSGGIAVFQVTGERTTKELTALAPFHDEIMVVAPTWVCRDWKIHVVFPPHISAAPNFFFLFFLPRRRIRSRRQRGCCFNIVGHLHTIHDHLNTRCRTKKKAMEGRGRRLPRLMWTFSADGGIEKLGRNRTQRPRDQPDAQIAARRTKEQVAWGDKGKIQRLSMQCPS